MLSQAQDVLQQMGLSDGYHIPIANAENVELEAELKRLILAKSSATLKYDSLLARCTGLDKHMKFIQNEQLDNQNLLVARNTQLECEKNMYILIKVDRDRFAQEIRKMTSDIAKLDEYKKSKCDNLKYLMSKMEKLKLSVEWDEQTIETLEESVLEKSDDNEILKKFSKEDQRRAHDLEVKRKRLREEELARRQLVSRTANEIENLELTLGRNVQMYKQLHDERNGMVRLWRESVKQLQQRNRDSISVVDEIATVRDMVAANNQTLEEQHQFAENERANNRELEAQIHELNSEVARMKVTLSKCSSLVHEQVVLSNGVRCDLQRTATVLEGARSEQRKIDCATVDERKVFVNIVSSIECLAKQLQSICQTKLTAEERMRRLEEMIHAEDMNTKSFLYDTERIQGLQYRSQKMIIDMVDAFKVKEMTQRVLETALLTLQRQLIQVEVESRQVAEIIYKINFRVNMIENRLARATGDRVDVNAEAHQLRLCELEKTMADINETSSLLQTQIARLEEDMRRLSSSSAADVELLQKLRDRLQNKMLMVEGALKLVTQRRGRNNMRQVEQNVLAVRVKGAERSLKLEGGAVYGLQRQKMELEAVVHERQAEVLVERELLVAKRRTLQEDNGRMRGDFQGRLIRIDHLKKRLDCVLSSLGRSDDGETLSVTYFRVRNAQEKYALQQEGDRLDMLIRKTEREIIAMENTLRVVNGTNDAYRKSLHLLDENSDELVGLQSLKEQLKQLGIETRSRNNELVDRSRIVRAVRDTLEVTRTKRKEVLEARAEKRGKLDTIQASEKERQIKLERAVSNASTPECICEGDYKDMDTRQMREVNKSALQQLAEICVRFMETSPVINRYLTDHGISLPPVSASLTSMDSKKRSSLTSSKSSLTSSRSESSSSSSVPAVFLTLNIP